MAGARRYMFMLFLRAEKSTMCIINSLYAVTSQSTRLTTRFFCQGKTRRYALACCSADTLRVPGRCLCRREMNVPDPFCTFNTVRYMGTGIATDSALVFSLVSAIK
jgi:hypothetical protein